MILAPLVHERVQRTSPWHPAVAQPRARYLQLAPGVWSLRSPRWVHAGALDSHGSLPAPDVDEDAVRQRSWPVPDWHTWALCGGMSFATFFGAANDERPTMKRSEIAYARGTCAGCPVKRECLDWALAKNERFGVWGGTSGRQRTRMRAEMRAEGLDAEQIADRWFQQWLGT